jgi:Hypoxia induced protein conserved region
MSTFFIICMVIAMVALLVVLVTGILSMAKGGAFNTKYGNKLMQARVYLQALALIMLVLAFMSSGGGTPAP